MQQPDKLISSILKHDTKQNSYKIALLRSINDVVLAYPDMLSHGQDVAIPLRMLARYWIAYYWAFVEDLNPIYQGARAKHGDSYRNDMAFRPALTELRSIWATIYNTSSPSDGFTLTYEMLIPRKQKEYNSIDDRLIGVYQRTLRSIEIAIQQPMRYAGTDVEGEFAVFKPLARFADADEQIIGIPGTKPQDKCIIVPIDMWEAFRELSLWIEALCIHEWSIFIEGVDQKDRGIVRRGEVFELLTARPDNRVPLNWERNRIFILMQEGITFRCVWTKRELGINDDYALDHLIPVSVYPMNEMWNLVPTHPAANLKKSDKIPSRSLLIEAQNHLMNTNANYHLDQPLSIALNEDSQVRFSTLSDKSSTDALASRVIDFMEHLADARNIARVENF